MMSSANGIAHRDCRHAFFIVSSGGRDTATAHVDRKKGHMMTHVQYTKQLLEKRPNMVGTSRKLWRHGVILKSAILRLPGG